MKDGSLERVSSIIEDDGEKFADRNVSHLHHQFMEHLQLTGKACSFIPGCALTAATVPPVVCLH